MAIKITKRVRATIKAIVDDSRQYDVSTVRIHKDGGVSARKDADKTFAGHDPMRYLVGYVEEMVTSDGQRRRGW